MYTYVSVCISMYPYVYVYTIRIHVYSHMYAMLIWACIYIYMYIYIYIYIYIYEYKSCESWGCGRRGHHDVSKDCNTKSWSTCVKLEDSLACIDKHTSAPTVFVPSGAECAKTRNFHKKRGRFTGNIKYKLAFLSQPVFSGTKAKLQTCLPKVD